MENLYRAISRKVNDICLTDTICCKPVTKKWVDYQMSLLDNMFKRLEILVECPGAYFVDELDGRFI